MEGEEGKRGGGDAIGTDHFIPLPFSVHVRACLLVCLLACVKVVCSFRSFSSLFA